MFTGVLEYDGSTVAFQIAHFNHPDHATNLWMLLGTGPWYEDRIEGSWVILQNWITDGKLVLRVADSSESPFRSQHIFDEHFLTRDDVLGKEGGLEWAIARRDDLLRLHKQSFDFLYLDDV